MKPHLWLGLVVGLVASARAEAATYVDDPLTAASAPGRGSKGGTFGANGWTVTAEADAVWYEITDALPAGRAEYTVTGLSLATSLTGVDHDIFTMYQAPTGQPEPIAYSPYFRNNDFKAFTRIFGINEPGRGGAMKLELAFCPRGDPYYHDTACPAGCDQSGIAYANGMQTDLGWDVNTSYRMALEWGNGQVTFYRDNAALGSIPYMGEYSPKPLRIRLGSPRHDGVYPGAAFMPIGITLKDLLVTGTPGSMTPDCGAGGAGGMSGAGGAGGGANPGEQFALADVTAASFEMGVFPDKTDLNVEADAAGAPTATVYLRFPAISGTVTHAVLRLHTADIPSAAGGSGVICPVMDSTWSEDTLTWATRPPVGATCAGAATTVDVDSDVDWDVTSLVVGNGMPINLAVVSQDANGAHFKSKEAGDPTRAPKLLLMVTPAMSTSSTSTTSTGAGGQSAATTGATSSGLIGAGGADDGAPRKGGCGCRVAPLPGGESMGLAAMLAGLLVARRRAGRQKGSKQS